MGKGLGYFTGYPKHVFLILGNEFCERFSFYGMKAILVLYFTRALNYTDDTATAVYHGFNSVCYFMPIFGAMLADGYLGKFNTILYLSIIYSIGNLVMSIGAIPQGGNYLDWVSYIALILIAIGTGGIKPCVSAFGADQFKDNQARQKETFFSMFYMAINLGSLLSMIITPILRSSVQCFDSDCYALAFGVPAILMVVAVIFFVVGSPFYTKPPPGNNIIGRLFGCIGTAISGRCTKKGGPREHWLDYSEEKYGKEFVTDVKAVLRVLFMFIPLPVFWALFDQQGSRWILQAGRMNGDMGGGFVLEPDQMQVINPLLVVIMVPLVESLFFPCLDKLKIPNRPLQRLGAGLLLCSLSFCITGGIEITINKTAPPAVPEGQARFHMINAAPCPVSYQIDSLANVTLETGLMRGPELMSHDDGFAKITADFSHCGGGIQPFEPKNFTDFDGFTFIFSYESGSGVISQHVQENTTRMGDGLAVIQVINTVQNNMAIELNEDEKQRLNISYLGNVTYEVGHNTYVVKTSSDYDIYTEIGSIETKAGAIYTLVIQKDQQGDIKAVAHEEVTPNDQNIFLQLPQYIVMSFGEVLFSVTGLSFAYSQAPASMKAVLQAGWLVTNAVGNLIVVIVAGAGIANQVVEYFFFAGLMFVTFIIFIIMSLFYVYVEDLPPIEEELDEEKKPPLDGEVNAAYIDETSAAEKEKEAEMQMESSPTATEAPPMYEEQDPGMVTSTTF